MIEVRRAESDADLEAWIRVKRAAEDGLTVSLTMLADLPLKA